MLSFGDAPLMRIVMPSCIATLPLSDLRQHLIAEAAHVVDRAIQRRSEQTHIDRTDAKLRQSLDVAHIVSATAGEHLTLAVDRAARPRRRSHQYTQRDLQGRGIAAALLGETTEPR